jgi:hypothetical protein
MSKQELENLKPIAIREFLNQEGEPGLAAIQIDGSTSQVWVTLGITISDCRKMIDLDLDFGNQKQLNNVRHKVRVLINTLLETEHWLERAADRLSLTLPPAGGADV